MKFGIVFANTGPFVDPDGAVAMARAAEAAGFESLWTVEHTVVPAGYESEYPYDRSGRMPGSDDAPIPDPLVWLAYLAVGDLDHPPGDRHPDPAPAQPGRAGQGGRHPRPPVGRSRGARAWASAGSRRSSTPSASPSPSGRRAPTTASPPCGRCGARTRPPTRASSPRSPTASAGPSPSRAACPCTSGATPRWRPVGRAASATASSRPGAATAGSPDCSTWCARPPTAAGRDPAAIELTSGGNGVFGPGALDEAAALAELGVDRIVVPAFLF